MTLAALIARLRARLGELEAELATTSPDRRYARVADGEASAVRRDLNDALRLASRHDAATFRAVGDD